MSSTMSTWTRPRRRASLSSTTRPPAVNRLLKPERILGRHALATGEFRLLPVREQRSERLLAGPQAKDEECFRQFHSRHAGGIGFDFALVLELLVIGPDSDLDGRFGKRFALRSSTTTRISWSQSADRMGRFAGKAWQPGPWVPSRALVIACAASDCPGGGDQPGQQQRGQDGFDFRADHGSKTSFNQMANRGRTASAIGRPAATDAAARPSYGPATRTLRTNWPGQHHSKQHR